MTSSWFDEVLGLYKNKYDNNVVTLWGKKSNIDRGEKKC